MAHIAAGRTDHIAAERSDAFPVRMTSKRDGTEEWATVEYAAERVAGYYDMEPEDIERDLRQGVPFETISFIYRLIG